MANAKQRSKQRSPQWSIVPNSCIHHANLKVSTRDSNVINNMTTCETNLLTSDWYFPDSPFLFLFNCERLPGYQATTPESEHCEHMRTHANTSHRSTKSSLTLAQGNSFPSGLGHLGDGGQSEMSCGSWCCTMLHQTIKHNQTKWFNKLQCAVSVVSTLLSLFCAFLGKLAGRSYAKACDTFDRNKAMSSGTGTRLRTHYNSLHAQRIAPQISLECHCECTEDSHPQKECSNPPLPPYFPLFIPFPSVLFCSSSPVLQESGPYQSSNSQQNDGWSGVPCLHQDHLSPLVGRHSPAQLHKPRPSTLLDHKVFRWGNWGSGGLVEFYESQSPEPELRHCSLPGIRALHHWKLLDLWDPRCSESSKWIDGGSSADIAAAPGCLVQTRWTTAGTVLSVISFTVTLSNFLFDPVEEGGRFCLKEGSAITARFSAFRPSSSSSCN